MVDMHETEPLWRQQTMRCYGGANTDGLSIRMDDLLKCVQLVTSQNIKMFHAGQSNWNNTSLSTHGKNMWHKIYQFVSSAYNGLWLTIIHKHARMCLHIKLPVWRVIENELGSAEPSRNYLFAVHKLSTTWTPQLLTYIDIALFMITSEFHLRVNHHHDYQATDTGHFRGEFRRMSRLLSETKHIQTLETCTAYIHLYYNSP